MLIPWEDIQLFLAVAETGSLSAAAKRLRVTQPTVSRRLADLESSLGEPLFARGVEGTTITAFGERLLEPARRMAENAGEVLRVASAAETTPRGTVRVTAPPGFAFELLAPAAARLRERYPEIDLEIASTTSYLDLARREADLAIRMAPLGRPAPASDLVVLASLEQRVRVFVAPSYAATLPKRPKVADLRWIVWAPPLDDTPPTRELAALIPGFRPVFAADDFLVQLRAAELGLGAVVLGVPRPRGASPTTLVELDLELGYPPVVMTLACARSSLAIPRVRAIADALAVELAPETPKRRAGAKPAAVLRGHR